MTDLPPESSLTVFDVPKSHRHCTFANFHWPSESIKAAVLEFLARMEAGQTSHLLVTGTPGVGKTHLAVAIYRWAVLKWGTMLCNLIQVSPFFDLVKASFNSSEENSPFLDVEDAKKLVALDDLLGRSPTPFEIDHVIFRLINTAHSNSASLVITSNQTIDQISQVLKPHEVSRILEHAVHLEVKGPDRRWQ